MEIITHDLALWGYGGAFFAAVFALWMYFFPNLVAPHFAWPAEPRLTQVFIGAGYIFRTGFFLSVALEPAWHRVEWIFWGNLVFTGTLLLATFWHADRFSWFSWIARLWVFLYVFEPVLMIYLAPHGVIPPTQPLAGTGAILPALKWFLVAEVMIVGTVGALLVLNPKFMETVWPWPLNPLDARIMAAWFLGWAVWAGTMAFGSDWDAIRIGVQLNLLFGLALFASLLVFARRLDFKRTGTRVYTGVIMLLTLPMLFFYLLQETANIP
jgi:hypothetical protein